MSTPSQAAAQPGPTVAIIPARLASTRLPRKVLRLIAGKPLLAWVVEAALRSPLLNSIHVATDSEEVASLCRQHRWPVHLTSPDLPSGSDRVHAVAQLLAAQGQPPAILVNIQGDEPLLHPDHIADLLQPFANPATEVSTLRTPCTPENVLNPNAVKVVCAPGGRALYFSRAPIPFHRDAGDTGQPARFWKHLGLYAYRPQALQRFTGLPPSPLELTERLEQLRFLEHGIPIHVATTTRDTVGVDTEADLLEVDRILRTQTLP